MIAVRPLAAVLVAGLALAAPAEAQTVTTRSTTVAPGKVARLVVVPSLKKDCSAGGNPEIKVVTAPKNGQLKSKSAKIKTPASYRCPGKEAQVAGVFYRSKADFTGTDQVVLEIKTAEGTVEKQDIRISVEAAKPDSVKPDSVKPDTKKADEKKDDKSDDKDLSDL